MSEADGIEVRAAGGVVWRRRASGAPEVALAHRPRYDDWSLPKGKLDPGERWEDAAAREVREEIGVRCRLGPELPSTGYRDSKGRRKLVRYWLMEALDGEFTPNDEVDEVRWEALDAARALLTYPRDGEVLAAAASALESR